MWSKLQRLHQITVQTDLTDDFDYLNITHFFMPKVIHIMSVIIYDPYAVKLFVQIWNP